MMEQSFQSPSNKYLINYYFVTEFEGQEMTFAVDPIVELKRGLTNSVDTDQVYNETSDGGQTADERDINGRQMDEQEMNGEQSNGGKMTEDTHGGEMNTVSMALEKRDIDVKEEMDVRLFIEKDCCKKQCNKKLDEKDVMEMRNNCRELKREEMDLLIMGELLTCMDVTMMTGGVRHKPHDRRRPRSNFRFHGEEVSILYNFIFFLTNSVIH